MVRYLFYSNELQTKAQKKRIKKKKFTDRYVVVLVLRIGGVRALVGGWWLKREP